MYWKFRKSNESSKWFLFFIRKRIKKVNSIIERLELEQDINKANKYSYQNYLFDKNVDELLSFSNYSKKNQKAKKQKARLDIQQ